MGKACLMGKRKREETHLRCHLAGAWALGKGKSKASGKDTASPSCAAGLLEAGLAFGRPCWRWALPLAGWCEVEEETRRIAPKNHPPRVLSDEVVVFPRVGMFKNVQSQPAPVAFSRESSSVL